MATVIERKQTAFRLIGWMEGWFPPSFLSLRLVTSTGGTRLRLRLPAVIEVLPLRGKQRRCYGYPRGDSSSRMDSIFLVSRNS